ncbi:MAG: MCE family protein [Bacteroidales bacterium]|nr:MCE family protein [Bacteroidales bacterium]
MNAEKLRNIKIGVFAIVAFVILCWGLSYLKGKDLFSRGGKLTAYFSNVDGLTDSSPVIFNGYKVGGISSIEIDQYTEDPSKLFCVQLTVDKKLEVPKDSRVIIVSTDILGGKGIELRMGKSPDKASYGDVLGSGIQSGLLDDIAPLKDKAADLMTSADGVMTGLDSLLSDKNRDKLDEAIAALAVTMRNVEAITRNLEVMTRNSGAIGGTFSSADGFMGNLNKQSGKIDTIMTNMSQLSSELAQTKIGSAMEKMDSLLGRANGLLASDGNIGKIASDDKLYENLTAAIDNLNRLLVDVRLNPSRYINVSAIKIGGKQVYFSDSEGQASVLAGKVYTICILSQKTPADMPTKLGGKKVYEYFNGKTYKYLVMPFATEGEAQAFITENALKTPYPQSTVEYYEDGLQKRK